MSKTKRRKSGGTGWDMSSLKKTKKIVPFKGLEHVATEKVRYSGSMTKRRPPQYSNKRAGT